MLWRHAVRTEHIRLYFAALDCGAPPAAAAALKAALGTDAAPTAAAELLSACNESMRCCIETAAAATARGAEYDENTAQQVVPRVWLGPLAPAESKDWLMAKGITHVLDATGGWRRRVSALGSGWAHEPPPASDEHVHLQLAAEDRADFDISPLLPRAVAFIRRALSEPAGAILVHCHSGVSRSATIVAAFLIEVHSVSLRCAMRVLCDARPACRPNAGFERALVRWELEARRAARWAAADDARVDTTSQSVEARGKKRPLDGDEAAALPTPASTTPAAPSAASALPGPTASHGDGHELHGELEDEEGRLLQLPLEEALSALSARLGSVPRFPRVADAVARLLDSIPPVGEAAKPPPESSAWIAVHAVLRRAFGNGKGPKLPKLRPSYAALFDAAMVHIERFPPSLAADISLWAAAAVTHPRLCHADRQVPMRPCWSYRLYTV